MDDNFLLSVLFAAIGLIFLLALIGSVVWAYNDAQARGKTGCLWVVIIWFTWPFGLIAYILLRDQDIHL